MNEKIIVIVFILLMPLISLAAIDEKIEEDYSNETIKDVSDIYKTTRTLAN